MTYQEAMNKAADELGFKPYIASLAYREWMAKSAELYARSKWNEACEAQMEEVYAHILPDGNTNIHQIKHWTHKPEFK